jgi:hypothetical protein
MERTAARAWHLRRQRHIGSSCDSLELLALHHARLLARSGAAAFGRSTAYDAASGRAGASGASATFLSMRVCRRFVARHARLLARSGAAAFGAAAFGAAAFGAAAFGRSTSGGAAGAPAPPAPLSAAFGRTAVLPNPASLAGDDASAARIPPKAAGF